MSTPEIRFATGKTPLGTALLARSAAGVCAILLGDDAPSLISDLRRRFPEAELREDARGLAADLAKVAAFIADPVAGLDLTLDLRGTPFQLRVWQLLREIPVGKTLSYTELAQRLGAPRSARAVAQACAANSLALAIPCHRVVRGDGGLSGYRWGVDRKRALLEREAAAVNARA